MFRTLIEQWLIEVCSPEILLRFFGFDRFKIQEISPTDKNLSSLVEGWRNDWGLKKENRLPPHKDADIIYLAFFDETNFQELATQEYHESDFWWGIKILADKLKRRIIVLAPCGSFELTRFTPGGLFHSSAPLILDEATLITHEVREIERRWMR